MPEAQVKVRNLSPTVPAINAMVHYYVSRFGIGMRRELKLTKVISLPPGSEAALTFPLDQSTLGGDQRAGVHVLIEHPHDPVTVNNEGSQVFDQVFTSEAGRTLTLQIPVLNDSNFSREIRLSIMSTDVIASVSPIVYVFAPAEQIIATLSIQVPSFLHGTSQAWLMRDVTVVGRLATGELLGGVTREILINE